MIKKPQKWIACFVTLTFIWLLQLSTQPVSAAGATEAAVSVSAEQGPNFIEQAGSASSAAGHKSILPYILIGVGVVAVAAVLFLVVLKTKYDPRGTWEFKWRDKPSDLWATESITLAGERTSGTSNYSGYVGTFSLDGKELTIEWTYPGGNKMILIGEFQTKDTVSGTYTASMYSEVDGQFELSRQSTATALNTPVAVKKVGQ
ncbi:MAG: hypothetical protein NTW95_08205 [Candidatus Aminicenantes bacterium]|nr:hypothetical protein [Candidatus Aminicenantes bacterium]